MAFGMGLLNTGLMPTQYNEQDKYSGLLGNPLLQIGLGILANNNGQQGFGATVAGGAMQGLGNVQKYQQLQRQNKMQDIQNQRYERESKQIDRKNAAIDKFKVAHPEYGDAIDIEPSLAIKAAYPQLGKNTADPYTTVQYDQQGNAYLFNQRETDPTKAMQKITIGGQPFTGAKYSPELERLLAYKKKYGEQGATLTDIIPGQVKTGASVIDIINGGTPNTLPQPTMPAPAPQPMQPMPPIAAPRSNNPPIAGWEKSPDAQVTPDQKAKREDVRMKVLLEEQATQGGAGKNLDLDAEIATMRKKLGIQPTMVAGGGIKVPTPVELAGQKAGAEQAAKNAEELKQTQALNDLKNSQGAVKALQTTGDMFKYLYPQGVIRDGSGRLLMPKDVPILGNSITDRIAMKGHEYGMHNDKASNIIGARRLVNNLVLAANNGSLGAGVSNADVDFLKSLQGITNTAQDPQDIYNAIADNEDKFTRLVKGANTQKIDLPENVPVLPSNPKQPAKAMQMPAKPSALTLKKGMVYATPKGNLTWNGKAFED